MNRFWRAKNIGLGVIRVQTQTVSQCSDLRLALDWELDFLHHMEIIATRETHHLIKEGNQEAVNVESACNPGDPGLICGSGRSPGEGSGNSLQYSWSENSMASGGWQTTVRGVTKSLTQLSDQHFHIQT